MIATRNARQLLRSSFLLAVVCAIGAGGVWALQMNFAGPTPEEYAARRPQSEIIAAGAFDAGHGKLVCGRAPTVLDPGFDDYAAAFFGFLIVNPERFRLLPPIVQRFAFAHECGHQFVGYSEIAADCYAARLGRKEGWLGQRELREVCAFFEQSKGSPFHLPGPQRYEAIRQCYGPVSDNG